MVTLESLWDSLVQLAMTYGLKIIGAIIILLVGRWLAKYAKRYTLRALDKMAVDEALKKFSGSLAYYGVIIIAIIGALNTLGVATASIVALLGASALAIGLALEGALSNLAAGVLLLFFRPFKIRDLVEIAGYWGHVEEIMIFSTILVTLDNKLVTIPNAQVTGSPIVNYTEKGIVRRDMIFGIGYGDDILKAKKVLEDILNKEDRVLEDPAPIVAVKELAESSVNFAVQPFIEPENYWPVYYAITEQVKLRFDAEGISIPFPQRDVHLMQVGNN